MIAHLSAALLAALAVAPQQQSDTTLAVAADGRLEPGLNRGLRLEIPLA